MSKTALDILKDARAYLADRRRWAQNTLDNGLGGVCTIGAIDRGAGIARYRPLVLHSPYGPIATYELLNPDTQEHAEAYRSALGYVRQALGVENDSLIALWNDDPLRAHEEVLEMFDRAIALAETESLTPLVLSSDDLSEPTVAEFPHGVHVHRPGSEAVTQGAQAASADRGRPDRRG